MKLFEGVSRTYQGEPGETPLVSDSGAGNSFIALLLPTEWPTPC